MYPSSRNLSGAITNIIKEYMEFPQFIATACDALCNANFENERKFVGWWLTLKFDNIV